MRQILFQTGKKIHRTEVFYVNQQERSKDVKIYRLTLLTSELDGASLSAIPTVLKKRTNIQLLGVISHTCFQHQKRLVTFGT